MNRIFILVTVLWFMVGCSKQQAQEGNVRYAMEMLGKCQFDEALSAANDAIYMGDENKQLLIMALSIKAKSLEYIGTKNDTNAAYQKIVNSNINVSTIDEARSLTTKLDTLLKNCKANLSLKRY